MRKPDENLDEYVVRPESKDSVKAPRAVSLQRTGEVQVLRPLTLRELRAQRYRSRGARQPLWFRRFLAIGSGALVTTALVLVSAILVAINDPVESDIATNLESDQRPVRIETPFGFEIFSPAATVEGETLSTSVRRPTRSRMLSAVKPRRRSAPAPQIEYSKFVPTTLVIYAQNGVINTRIEPWIQDDFKKLPVWDN